MRIWVAIACALLGCMLGLQVRLGIDIMRLADRIDALEAQANSNARNIAQTQRNNEVLGYEVIRHGQTIGECQRFFDLGVVPVPPIVAWRKR